MIVRDQDADRHVIILDHNSDSRISNRLRLAGRGRHSGFPECRALFNTFARYSTTLSPSQD
jgi:hypothetical protein